LDLFEFILIITSVIFALAVAQILSGISRVAQSTTAIRYYFPHSLWIVNLFLFIFLIWWASWEFRGIQWTFPSYAYMLIAPTLLFFSCSLLIPQQLSDANADLEEHFFRIRRPLFASYFLAALTVMVDGNLLSDEDIWHNGRYGQAAILAAAVWAYASTNKNVHRIIAIVTTIAFLALIATRFWNPR
jgi:hypothetical protein